MADAVDSCDNSASDANTILSGMKKMEQPAPETKSSISKYEKQVTRHRKLFKFSVIFSKNMQKFGLHGANTAIFLPIIFDHC